MVIIMNWWKMTLKITILVEKEYDYRNLFRKKIRETAFKELKTEQAPHSKVKAIIYGNFEAQRYLKSSLFSNEDVSILSNLRSHTTKTIRANFKNDKSCPLMYGEQMKMH